MLAVIVAAAAVPVQTAAQVPCIECGFTVSIVQWNGTATPEGIAGGTLRVTNTGDAADSYTIQVSVDNDTWTSQVEPEELTDVPPGEGLFASDENSATFDVRVLVPANTRANSVAAVTVTVTSQNSPELEETETLETRAKQVYDWTLDCTEAIEVQKSKRAEVDLTARNDGNGADRATITYTPLEGIVVSDPKAFDLGPREETTHQVEVGVGLRAEDGEYTIRWDLKSGGDPQATAQCTTVFTVTGGTTSGPGGEDGDHEDSPGPGLLIVAILPLLLALSRMRRRP